MDRFPGVLRGNSPSLIAKPDRFDWKKTASGRLSFTTYFFGGDRSPSIERQFPTGTRLKEPVPDGLRRDRERGGLDGLQTGTRNLSTARRGYLSDVDTDQSTAEIVSTVPKADSRRDSTGASDPAPSSCRKWLFAANHGRGISVTMPVFTRTLISFSTIP